MKKKKKARAKKHHHNVYVIELDPRVLNIARFRNANPNRDMLKACLYVGMTGLTPEERFAKHKAGIRANSYVQRFGVRLVPEALRLRQPDALRRRARHGSGTRHRPAGSGLRRLAG